MKETKEQSAAGEKKTAKSTEEQKNKAGSSEVCAEMNDAVDRKNVQTAGKQVENKEGPEKPPEPLKTSQAEDGYEKEIAGLKKEIAELRKGNADLQDQVLRRAADFDNYRKRMLKEKQDAFDYANENLLQDLLDSLDDFDRTVDASASTKDIKSIADGIRMISEKLVNMLETKYNLVSYGASGDLFVPDMHQAIGSVKGPVAEPVLKEVYLKGYKLRDKIIRHAKVMVTMPDGSVKKDSTDTKEVPAGEKK